MLWLDRRRTKYKHQPTGSPPPTAPDRPVPAAADRPGPRRGTMPAHPPY